LAVGVRKGMDVVVGADMSGRWYLVSSFLWLVTKVFGYIISKSRGLCGGVVCVCCLYDWLGVVCWEKKERKISLIKRACRGHRVHRGYAALSGTPYPGQALIHPWSLPHLRGTVWAETRSASTPRPGPSSHPLPSLPRNTNCSM
jgi:hypothetical protein